MASKKETSALNHEFDALNREANQVEKELTELAGTAAIAAKQVDNLGDQARGSAASMAMLDARIKATRVSVQHLGEEFARTGDQLDGKNFGREKALLGQLERLKKTLEALEPAAPLLPDSWMNKKINLPFAPPVPAAAVAGAGAFAVGALPAISAGIAAAVIGGVGIGGVVGGAILAAQDERVQKAWAQLGTGIMDELKPVQEVFVGPVIKAAGTFGASFAASGIVETLESAVKLVDPLSKGLGGFVAGLGPGLRSIIDQAAPVFDVLERDLPAFGNALSTSLDSIGDSAGPAAIALHDFFREMNSGIETTAVVAGGLAKIYPLIRPLTTIVPLFGISQVAGMVLGADKPVSALGGSLEKVRYSGEEAATGVGAFGLAAGGAATAAAMLDTAANRVYETFLLFTSDEIAVEAAIDNLSDAFARNGTTMDITNEAGRENVSLLISIAQNARDTISDMIAHGASVEETNAKYAQFRAELYDTFIQAGKTAEEAQALVDKWLALEALPNIAKFVTYSVNTVYRSTGTPPMSFGPNTGVSWGGGLQEFDEGGMVEGPMGSAQLAVVHAGERVLTREQQAQQWNGGGSYGSSGDRTITVIVKDTSGRTLRGELINDATNRNVDSSTIQAAYP